MRKGLAVVLGSWHAALLLLFGVLILHMRGNAGTAVAGVGLPAGLAAGVLLWLIAVVSAWYVLTRGGQAWIGLAAVGGGVAGPAFLAGLLVIFAVKDFSYDIVVFAFFALVFGLLPAAFVGATVGMAFAGLDRLVAGSRITNLFEELEDQGPR